MSDFELVDRSVEMVVAPIVAPINVSGSKFGGVFETGINLSELDIAFKIKKTSRPKPNVAHIRVWGLSKETRQYFHSHGKLGVKLAAGYKGQNELLFIGETRASYSHMENKSVVTHFETGDSEKDMAATGIEATFGDPTNLKVAIERLLTTLPDQVSENFIGKLTNYLGGADEKMVFPMPAATSRQSTRMLEDLCRSAGLRYSIQNGQIQIMPKDGVIESQVIYLTPSTGLIGSPAVDHRGHTDIRSLIIPGLHPGVKIYVDAFTFQGYFRIEDIEYMGEIGVGKKDWYCKMDCVPIKTK